VLYITNSVEIHAAGAISKGIKASLELSNGSTMPNNPFHLVLPAKHCTWIKRSHQ
jgi:hypothetical protein